MGIFDRLFGKTSTGGHDGSSSEDYLSILVKEIQSREATGGYESLVSSDRMFFCIWTLEAEVNNGGFHQFYANSSGDIAADVPAALRAVGASHTAGIVERANAVFGPAGPPVDREERERVLEEVQGESRDEEFDKLDNEFLEYRDDLSALLAAFMKQRRAGV